MSMPSSSDAVATSARSSPAFSRCSSAQAALLREAAVVRARRAPRRAARARLCATRSASAARVHEDERGAVLRDQLGDAVVDLAPLLVGSDGLRARPAAPRSRGRGRAGGRRRRSCSRGAPVCVDCARCRPRKRATSSIGCSVAERPMRAAGRLLAQSASSRSSESARWLPRLSRISAWISSTMTVRTLRSSCAAALGREHQVERLGRGDQDVRRRARRIAARAACVVSPVRSAGADLRQRDAQSRARRRGCSVERRLEVALDVVAERLQRRDVDDVDAASASACRRARASSASRCSRGTPPASCRSRWARRSACRAPAAMRGQPASCASVGAPKRRSNQARTAGWKESNAVTVFGLSVVRSISPGVSP